MESKLVVLPVKGTNEKVSFVESDELKERLYQNVLTALKDNPEIKSNAFVAVVLDSFQFKQVVLKDKLDNVLEDTPPSTIG